MLKIYRMTITYKIQNKNETIYLNSYSNYAIEEEQDAVPITKEFSAYDEDLYDVYHSCCVYKKKRGKLSVFEGSDVLRFKEWKCPDAKLIVSISYREAQCSMQQLFKLDANDVIAYLKQEGVVLSIPS